MFTKSQLFILFLTLVCFIVWLTSDLVKTPASFTPDEATTKALEPLNPEFDQSALSIIQQSNKLQPSPSPTITPRSRPTSSPNIASPSSRTQP